MVRLIRVGAWAPHTFALVLACGLAVGGCGGEGDDNGVGGGSGTGGHGVGGSAGTSAAGKSGTSSTTGGAGSAGSPGAGGIGGGGIGVGRGGAAGAGGSGVQGGTSSDAGAAGMDSGPAPITAPKLPAPGASITREAQGEIVIKTDADAETFCASYDGVRGSLRVTGSLIENLNALSCLVEVTGQLELSAYSLKHANLPKLVAVGTLFVATQTALEDIAMPKLEFTRNELRIVTSGPKEVALPALTSVGAALTIASITSLETISLPALTWVSNKIDFSNSRLREVDVTNLAYAGGDFRLTATALEHLSLMKLRQILGLLSIPGGSYADIDLTALERADGGLGLGGDETSVELTELDLPKLEVVGTFGASGFANLTRVSAPLLVRAKAVALGPAPLLASVSFPLLEDAGSFTLEELGDSVELGFPQLTTATSVRVRLAGRGAFDLPKLAQVTSLDVTGALDVSLPALQSIKQTGLFGNYSNAGEVVECDISLPLLASATVLEFRAGPKGVLELPALTHLVDLHLSTTGFESVTADALPSLRALRVGENAALTSLSFPALESAEDADFGDTALTTLALPKLATSTKYLSFDVPALDELELPALTTASELHISGSNLTTLNLPLLDNVYTFDVSRTAVGAIELPALTEMYELIAEQNPLLENVTFLAGSDTYNLRLVDNPLLATLVVSQPAEAGSIYIDQNPSLSNLDGIAAARSHAIAFTITNNVALTSIASLGPVVYVLGDITIYGNTALSADAVNGFVASIENFNGDLILTPP